MSHRHSPDLHVKLFGGPILLQGDEEVPLSPFQSYLLALVYGHGPRGISRAKAAWLLWELDDTPRTRHRLSQLGYAIGKKVGGRVVILRRRHQLFPGPYPTSDWIDAPDVPSGSPRPRQQQRFLQLLSEDLPTKAFEDWLHSARITQRRRRSEHLRSSLKRARAAGNLKALTDVGSAILKETVTDHEALYAVVWGLILQGRTSEAKERLENVTDLARLSAPTWSPPTDVCRLIERARAEVIGQADAVPPEMIGRGTDLHTLAQSIDPVGGGWTTTVISGEPGIGKTRLLTELAARLRLRGAQVVNVRCYEAERQISFNLMAEILEARPFRRCILDLPTPWLGICRSVFPCALPDLDRSEATTIRKPVTNTRTVHDALEHLFSLVASSARLVLLIDDFHWTDPSTTSAISFLCRRLSRAKISLVLSLVLDGVDEAYAATSFLRSLDGHDAKWHVLDPLGPNEIEELLQSEFLDALSAGDRRTIADISMGVPLFALELAGNHLTGPPSELRPGLTTTKSAQALFRQRQNALTPAARHILRSLAVLGRPIGYEALMGCTGLDCVQFMTAIEEVREHRLATIEQSKVEIRHQLARGVVYGELSATTRQRYHEAWATFLAREPARSSPAELALHFWNAGLSKAAHTHAISAAQQAAQKGAFEHARRMLELAVASAQDDGERLHCLIWLGTLCDFHAHHAEAAVHFNSAVETATSMAAPLEGRRARVAALRALVEIGEIDLGEAAEESERLGADARHAGDLHTYLKTLDLIIRIADYSLDAPRAAAALQLVDALDVTREQAEVRCLREIIRTRHICYGDPRHATMAADVAVAIAEENDLSEYFGQAVKRSLVVLNYRGQLDRDGGKRRVDSAILRFRQAGDQAGVFDVLINYSTWLADTGRLVEAGEFLSQAEEFVRDLEDAPERAVFSCNKGEWYLYQRDYLSAREHFRNAWEHSSHSRQITKWVAAGGLGLCALETGDLGLIEDVCSSLPPDAVICKSPTFDPTPIALFRARRLEVRRAAKEAAHLLHEYGEGLRKRIVPAWLKIRLAEVALRRKHQLGHVQELAREGRDVAHALHLIARCQTFDQYLV